MSFVIAGVAAAAGITKIGMALAGRKNRIQEHHNKKINLDKRMLEAYYAVLDRLQTYNQQKQLERANAEQGKFLDIEVK